MYILIGKKPLSVGNGRQKGKCIGRVKPDREPADMDGEINIPTGILVQHHRAHWQHNTIWWWQVYCGQDGRRVGSGATGSVEDL